MATITTYTTEATFYSDPKGSILSVCTTGGKSMANKKISLMARASGNNDWRKTGKKVLISVGVTVLTGVLMYITNNPEATWLEFAGSLKVLVLIPFLTGLIDFIKHY